MPGAKILDRYIILERIAAGGYSVVYRAGDERLNRPVCAKVFHRLSKRDGAYQSAYEHFIQEAFALSKLTHPNTLRIYDFGYLPDGQQQGAGAPFQVSEFMDLGTLSARVRREGPVRDVAKAARIITGLSGALAEAHQYGIIHRDIKPQNILFNTVGRGWVVKLADFGIAKSLPTANSWLDEQQVDDTAVVAGRPLVMYSQRWAAPEQMIGQPIDVSADIYSLALSIAFMLTGNVAFARADGLSPYEQRRLSEEYIARAFENSPWPSGVIALLQAACRFDASARPTDAEQFGQDVAQVLTARAAGPSVGWVPRVHVTTTPEPKPGAARAITSPPASPRRVHVTEEAVAIADRHGYFIPAHIGSVDVACCAGEQRLRVTFVPTGDAVSVHIKGLTCFVSLVDGRPSSAVQFERDGRCNLLSPARQQVASVAVSLGKPAAGHRLFTIGTDTIALSIEECPLVTVLDFGSGSECLIIYRPASSHVSNSRGRRQRMS